MCGQEVHSSLPVAGVLLGDAAKRWAILFAAVVVSFAAMYQAARLYVAWDLGRSSNPAAQIRGANLEGNAEAWGRLGEATAANFDNFQPDRARAFFERSVHLNPRSARLWMDLAGTYEEQGNISEAKSAYLQAQKDYPISADVAWRFGNFLLRQGQTSEGLEKIHRAILADPKLAPLAISVVWSFEPNVDVLLHRVLPYDRDLYFEALDFLAAKHQEDAALQTWQEIVNSPAAKPLRLPSAFPFMDDLIASDRSADAQRVWEEALKEAHWPQGESEEDSVVWNGGFEAPIANGGLGWRFDQEPGYYISIDPQVHHSGEQSLRVDFTGGFNLDFAAVQQFLPVHPRAMYSFRCFIRTRSISTESGMRFEIVDPNHHEVNADTTALTGTNPWTLVSANFTTGADTHFLNIRLRRFPSQLFDNKLSGTVWVDDVTLTPSKPNEPAESTP